MTNRITAALEAADKATPGPWVVGGKYTVRTTKSSSDWICRVRDIHHRHSDEEDSSNATLIAAAPDMAAEIVKLRKWQSEAVEWVQQAAANRSSLIKTWRELKLTKLIPDIEKNIIDIDRLIAEAKEQGNGRS